MIPRRLSRLPEVAPGLRVAAGARARLLGLAGLSGLPPGVALLLPRCSSVHTFGMRFPIDILFLDARGEVISERRNVPPGRILRCRGAASVLERQAEPTSAASR